MTRVDPASNAASAGIRQGDLIQEVNRQPVKTIVEFGAAVQQSGARPALVLVKRRNARDLRDVESRLRKPQISQIPQTGEHGSDLIRVHFL